MQRNIAAAECFNHSAACFFGCELMVGIVLALQLDRAKLQVM